MGSSPRVPPSQSTMMASPRSASSRMRDEDLSEEFFSSSSYSISSSAAKPSWRFSFLRSSISTAQSFLYIYPFLKPSAVVIVVVNAAATLVESLYSSIITFIFERPKQYDDFVGYDKGKERPEYCRRLLSAIHIQPWHVKRQKKRPKKKFLDTKLPLLCSSSAVKIPLFFPLKTLK